MGGYQQIAIMDKFPCFESQQPYANNFICKKHNLLGKMSFQHLIQYCKARISRHCYNTEGFNNFNKCQAQIWNTSSQRNHDSE
jgi:hypothetical protein